jgi:signal transduction histidine kinase
VIGDGRQALRVSRRPSRRSVEVVGTVPDENQQLPSHQRLLDQPNSARELGPSELPVRRWPERRFVVLVFAALLLIAAFAASMLSERALGELAVLYIVPVMLAGLELGVLGGAGAAAIAVVLLFAASGRHSELAGLGLAASSASFLIAGVLAGRFSQRMRAARNRQERLLISGLRLARLDTLDALPTVLAEELEQALDLASVQVDLHGAPAVEVGRSVGETLRVPISAHGIGFGSLTLGLPAGRSFTPEDRVVAEKLALQAGVAADNQRLLTSERERAALRAELEQTRGRLASHLRNVSRILENQEAERREIAHHLHDQAAQAMAGVLLGLHVLERDLDEELPRKQLEDVSDVARGTLADLRQLAVTVRPPSLDDLGLQEALEGIAERESTRGARQITLQCDTSPHELAPELEACAYRVADEAIRALHGPLTVKLNVDHDRDTLGIELTGRSVDQREQLLAKLAAAQARLELMGGTLHTIPNRNDATTIVATLPLHSTPDTTERGDRLRPSDSNPGCEPGDASGGLPPARRDDRSPDDAHEGSPKP